MNYGLLNLEFHDSKLNIVKNEFNINNIGKLNFKKILFEESQNKLLLKTKINIKINNQLQLYKKFSIKRKNRLELKSIDLDLDMNIDDNIYYISNISLNNKIIKGDKKENIEDSIKYEIENFQQLRKVVQSVFENSN